LPGLALAHPAPSAGLGWRESRRGYALAHIPSPILRVAFKDTSQHESRYTRARAVAPASITAYRGLPASVPAAQPRAEDSPVLKFG